MSGEAKWPKDAAEYLFEPHWYGQRRAELWIVGVDRDDIECTFSRHNPTDAERAETEALAQLYASAPNLYAALERLLNERRVLAISYWTRAEKAAADALAAARGETTPPSDTAPQRS